MTTPHEQVKLICQSLDGVTSTTQWGHTIFRNNGEAFAAFPGSTDFPISIAFIATDPTAAADTRIFCAPQFSNRTWFGLNLDSGPIDWDEIKDILQNSHQSSTGN